MYSPVCLSHSRLFSSRFDAFSLYNVSFLLFSIKYLDAKLQFLEHIFQYFPKIATAQRLSSIANICLRQASCWHWFIHRFVFINDYIDISMVNFHSCLSILGIVPLKSRRTYKYARARVYSSENQEEKLNCKPCNECRQSPATIKMSSIQ